MERLNLHLLQELQPDWPMGLCGPAGCHFEVGLDAKNVLEAKNKPLWKFLMVQFFNALRMTFRLKPQFIVAGSGLVAPMVLLAARLVGARAVVYLHGLDVVAQNAIYQAIWLPCIRRFDLILVNSHHTRCLALRKHVPEAKITILTPGVSIPIQRTQRGDNFFVNQHGLKNRKLLLSVGRLTPRKGLIQFVSNSLASIAEQCPDVLLVHIGGEASEALFGSGNDMQSQIEHAAKVAGVADFVRFIGPVDDATLGEAYSAASVHVFPVLGSESDVEGFGMVAMEAASHGVPTVAFAVGGVPDAVDEPISGRLVSANNYGLFSQAVLGLLAEPWGEVEKNHCRAHADGFSWQRFGKRLRESLSAELCRMP